MESKIQVGEYIRTKNGIIAKVINPEYYIELYIECEGGKLIQKGNIKKHSFNIIDLIEEGDYVNGVYIEGIGIRGYNDKYLETLELDGEYKYINIFPSEIHSIVTKEQFKSLEYEV